MAQLGWDGRNRCEAGGWIVVPHGIINLIDRGIWIDDTGTDDSAYSKNIEPHCRA